MDFIVSAVTDTGIVKTTNQDSYRVRIYHTPQGKMVFAVLCDGMGGLAKGEVASASVVNAFCKWADKRLPILSQSQIFDHDIRKEWTETVLEYNSKIQNYARSCSTNMGTTVTAILLTEKRYYIINVGDTRVYEIGNQPIMLTRDHTVVAHEVELGRITEEEAEKDSRRSVLLQCVGASDTVSPDLFFGNTKLNTVYMLCSDGFRHEISKEEMAQYLNPSVMLNAEGMKHNMEALIALNKQRQERDNISVISIRTF